MNKFTIPVYQPSLTGNEKKYVNACLDSTWISSKGEFINAFENKFAEYIHVNHATSVANGTVALHLALLALDIGPGDEVILPTLTYIASANAIKYVGAKPVFVDSLPSTWQMDPKEVAKKITPKTKAIMAVHLYGHPCAMTELTALTKKHGIYLIEDCAEACGSFYNARHVGTFGDIATFSFFGNKTITTGEGGMVVSQNDEIMERCKKLKSQGIAGQPEYWHDVIGYNFRMTNICAAIGLAQLERIEEILQKKKQVAEWYREALQDSLVEFHQALDNIIHSYWMCSILVNKPEQRDLVRTKLAQAGIETRPLFYPVHTMPMYNQQQESFPVAEDLGARGINLPSWPELSKEQVRYIAQQIKEASCEFAIC